MKSQDNLKLSYKKSENNLQNKFDFQSFPC